MFFNSRISALLLATFLTLANVLILVVLTELSAGKIAAAGAFIFVAGFAVYYLVFEKFIISEINKVYTLLIKIKKKDYKKISREEIIKTDDPLEEIKNEIADFAKRKEQEITELKKLETFRREFLADVSHELKTPIFSAQGFVHTLIDGAMDDAEVRDKFLTKAASNLDALNVLVEDLITISQLEIGEISMQYLNFDIYRLTEDIFEQLEESAAQRNIKLRFDKYVPRSCYVFADKYRIGQVLTNLIVNAIKYGKEKGNVAVSFVFENEKVLVSVQDDGPGIEPRHLDRIFERFYRVEKSRSRDKGGSGLGLSIVKHILEAHHSSVNVNSKTGKGTTFSFRLKKGKVINEKG